MRLTNSVSIREGSNGEFTRKGRLSAAGGRGPRKLRATLALIALALGELRNGYLAS
jgi:hypothetical protein